eukprot:1606334-Amphidinium_carterae.2
MELWFQLCRSYFRKYRIVPVVLLSETAACLSWLDDQSVCVCVHKGLTPFHYRINAPSHKYRNNYRNEFPKSKDRAQRTKKKQATKRHQQLKSKRAQNGCHRVRNFVTRGLTNLRKNGNPYVGRNTEDVRISLLTIVFRTTCTTSATSSVTASLHMRYARLRERSQWLPIPLPLVSTKIASKDAASLSRIPVPSVCKSKLVALRQPSLEMHKCIGTFMKESLEQSSDMNMKVEDVSNVSIVHYGEHVFKEDCFRGCVIFGPRCQPPST